MRCAVCDRQWCTPFGGGVYYVNNEPVCSLDCADKAIDTRWNRERVGRRLLADVLARGPAGRKPKSDRRTA
ncbi:MAG: hypothetical protein ACYTG0_02385 [Planctomycetota bacterium]